MAHLSQHNVILHIDLDAFYAQVEMKRLNVPRDEPLAVQQWNGLIAVNYPARKFGIGRHVKADEARKLCPGIHLIHVGMSLWLVTLFQSNRRAATINEAGESVDDPSKGTSKVSLERYRLASFAIFEIFLNTVADQNCERASIDEVCGALASETLCVNYYAQAYLDVTSLITERLEKASDKDIAELVARAKANEQWHLIGEPEPSRLPDLYGA